jgi:hypothetical protein
MRTRGPPDLRTARCRRSKIQVSASAIVAIGNAVHPRRGGAEAGRAPDYERITELQNGAVGAPRRGRGRRGWFTERASGRSQPVAAEAPKGADEDNPAASAGRPAAAASASGRLPAAAPLAATAGC